MPVVKVTWYTGRTHQQKAELARAITEAVVRIGKTTAEHTQVVFEDVAKEDWATAGVLESDRK
ncbi:MAG: tautomerase family protein [Chloroflexi bacterium]|nr:tautomerase family protein [Chloroflexota bacterium]MCL5108324.1 tautomerase family protein [Chloroflexota bacterium]MDA8218258.1 tautomerase family protein [Dehalococcoidales bacterium]